jgi:hypothetical protein
MSKDKNLKLLKNEDEFEDWRENNIFDGDIAHPPKEYPCFVTKIVESWSYEYEKAIFYYKSTLEAMINQL